MQTKGYNVEFANFYVSKAKSNPEIETPVLGHKKTKTESKIPQPHKTNWEIINY